MGYTFTGQRRDGYTQLIHMGARWYNASTGRWISADTIVPDPADPQSLNRFSYVLGNPLKYYDPSGHTVRSALDLVRRYRSEIAAVAGKHGINPLLLAGVVFAENRNDHNWVRGQDWSGIFTLGLFGGPELKNLIAPWATENPATGITEVTLAVAAMMDSPGLVPENYGDLTYEKRAALHQTVAEDLSSEDRSRILSNLTDPVKSLEYSAKYLAFLATYRDYGDDYALWLSDYNRGLSEWDTTSEYGERVNVYGDNIARALNWQDAPWTCDQSFGCGVAYDVYIYGDLE